jgi:hypothetical protein
MSRDIEDRLVDLFQAIDRQMAHEPLPQRRPVGRPGPVIALVAATVAVLVGIVGLIASRIDGADEPATLRPADALAASEFDERADVICLRLVQARNGIAPRFRTAEAFTIVVASRRAAIDDAIAGLMMVPPPIDEPALVSTVVDALGATHPLLDEIERLAIEGRLIEAAEWWPRIDQTIDQAVVDLATHGAAACGG